LFHNRLLTLDVIGLGYCSYDLLAVVDEMPAFDDVRGIHLADLVHDGGGPVGTALTAAAIFANAVAALNCQTLGGRRGLPVRADVDAFLQSHGQRG